MLSLPPLSLPSPPSLPVLPSLPETQQCGVKVTALSGPSRCLTGVSAMTHVDSSEGDLYSATLDHTPVVLKLMDRHIPIDTALVNAALESGLDGITPGFVGTEDASHQTVTVTRLMSGGDLTQMSPHTARCTVVGVLRSALTGLMNLHDRLQAVVLDVKPDNVFVEGDSGSWGDLTTLTRVGADGAIRVSDLPIDMSETGVPEIMSAAYGEEVDGRAVDMFLFGEVVSECMEVFGLEEDMGLRSLVAALCEHDPCRRATASQALTHPVFRSASHAMLIPTSTSATTSTSTSTSLPSPSSSAGVPSKATVVGDAHPAPIAGSGGWFVRPNLAGA